MDETAAEIAKTSSEEAVAAAAAHAAAIETSRADSMSAMLNNPELEQRLEDAVVRALGRGAAENRYIDIGRIPFICDDIKTISDSLKTINQKLESLSTYPLVKIIVFGMVGVVLLAVLGEILYTIGLGHSASIS